MTITYHCNPLTAGDYRNGFVLVAESRALDGRRLRAGEAVSAAVIYNSTPEQLHNAIIGLADAMARQIDLLRGQT